MNDDYNSVANLDSADCLEAVVAFRSFKNLLFWVALICLAALQAIFWANYLGRIDKTDCPCPEVRPTSKAAAVHCPAASPVVALAAEAAIAGGSSEAACAADPADPCAGCKLDGTQTAGLPWAAPVIEMLKHPTCREMVSIIGTLNYILFLAVVLFSLTLLVTLKISIAGRLGGIGHISQAFLQALLLLVLIVPWQVCLPNTVVGAIYTPGELLCSKVVQCGAQVYDCVFYFGRYVGLWVIVLVLLLAAEIRSVRWSRAVSRRLGTKR